jgi:cyclopropane-fatty-acyl-phospholipid synthase
MSMIIELAEAGRLPDALIRAGIRTLNQKRLREEHRGGIETLREHQRIFVSRLRQSPIAVLTEAANEQHYEVPPEFFQLALGKNRKYSCCYYPSGAESLDEAEDKMLALTCERAQLQDGMDILELGCGWGLLTLRETLQDYNGRRPLSVLRQAGSVRGRPVLVRGMGRSRSRSG